MKETFYSTSFYLQRDYSNYYALFFLTNSILGLERVIDAKWKIDPIKGQGFLLENRQYSFFKEREDEISFDNELLRLQNIILDKLADKSNISNCDLYYIAIESNFRPTHAVQILKELQNTKIISVSRADGENSKRGAFYVNSKYSKEVIINVSLAK